LMGPPNLWATLIVTTTLPSTTAPAVHHDVFLVGCDAQKCPPHRLNRACHPINPALTRSEIQ
jgi:hypothetical protein